MITQEAGRDMKERPILFSAPMVLAILEGRKTQTRRIVKPQPEFRHGVFFPEGSNTGLGHDLFAQTCPFGKPGDRLWVKETWRIGAIFKDDDVERQHVTIDYRADDFIGRNWLYVENEELHQRLVSQSISDAKKRFGTQTDVYRWKPGQSPCRWRPSIHMPRWASRITLEITNVRVERLQAISKQDAIAEGIILIGDDRCVGEGKTWRIERDSPTVAFRDLWMAINGIGSWYKNPYVWTIEFRRI